MEIDPVLIIVVVGSVGGLLIERFFYYRSKYRKKPITVPNPPKPDNPGHGERLGILETEIENLKENNEKDHQLIRGDIRKLSNLLNGMRRPGK